MLLCAEDMQNIPVVAILWKTEIFSISSRVWTILVLAYRVLANTGRYWGGLV